jgi:ferredoxin
MAELVVNKRKCLKSGQCTYLHPDLFREGEDGYPVVVQEHPVAERLRAAEDATEICPGQAISLVTS